MCGLNYRVDRVTGDGAEAAVALAVVHALGSMRDVAAREVALLHGVASVEQAVWSAQQVLQRTACLPLVSGVCVCVRACVCVCVCGSE